MQTLADFPRFTVEVVETIDEDSYRIAGTFDRIDGVSRDGWDYLVGTGIPGGMTATVLTFDETSKQASYKLFATDVKYHDLQVGMVLGWLSSYWDPLLIFAISRGPDVWKPLVFQPSTAYYWAKGAWTNNEEGAKRSAGLEGIIAVPGGWDHEHCDLCNKHIDDGDKYWLFEDGRSEFLCDACYAVTVPSRDLTEFVAKSSARESAGAPTP
jgi:hypothetical protein